MTIIEFFERQSFKFVRGAKLGRVRDMFLNVDFGFADQAIRLSGRAADMPDHTEAFYLDVSLVQAGVANPKDEFSTWGVIDMLWKADILLKEARSVSFYKDREDYERGLREMGNLDSAVAIELSAPASGMDRIVFFATVNYPCSVEVLSDPARCDNVLGSLERFVPIGVQSVRLLRSS